MQAAERIGEDRMPANTPGNEEPIIQCPVCRATQTARQVCRRCSADLELFVRARISNLAARRRLAEAVAAGDAVAQARLRRYLRWLHG
jgi:hypothetical protein